MAAQLSICNADSAPSITAMLRSLTIETPKQPSPKLPPRKRARTEKYTKTPDLELSFFLFDHEVREKIYRHALVVEKIVLNAFPLRKYDERKLREPNFALLRASKLINSEAEKIFYNENTFVIMTGFDMAAQVQDPLVLKKFLMIRRLEIVYDFEDWRNHYSYVGKSVRAEAARLEAEIERCGKAGDWMGEQTNAYSRKDLLKQWDQMTSKKFIKEKMTPADRKAYHDDQIGNMGVFSYGLAINIARDYLKLDDLILDYQNFRCYNYCCHLAIESMTWGTVKGWKYGPPRNIWTWGTYDREEDRAIMKAIMAKDEKKFKYKAHRFKRRP